MTHVVVTGVHERRRAGCAALLAVCALTACQHYQTELPGTLDLRSDGADAPLETAPVPAEATRNGLEAWMKGAGVSAKAGGAVVAEDRAVWALRVFPLGDGAADEVRGALGTGGALRALTLREEISVFDAALYACTLPIPCVDLGTATMLPSYTVQVAGTRVRPQGAREAPHADAPLVDEAASRAPAPEATPTIDRPARAGASAP